MADGGVALCPDPACREQVVRLDEAMSAHTAGAAGSTHRLIAEQLDDIRRAIAGLQTEIEAMQVQLSDMRRQLYLIMGGVGVLSFVASVFGQRLLGS